MITTPITTPISTAYVHGVAELEPTGRGVRLHRLPAWVREQFPDGQLLAMETQPAGARLVVRTSATTLELVSHLTRVAYRGADRARGCFDVYVDGGFVARDVLDGGDAVVVDLQTGATAYERGPSHTTALSGLPEGDKIVEVWLPHNEGLELVALRTDAPTEPVVSTRPRWLHHGSSISHGSNAAAPSETWPAVAARRAGVELVNLGLGGSALIDPFLARVIRDTTADVISVKLGINVVNLDSMRLRAFVPAVHGFLDTIRDGHPDTPLLLVSPIFCGIHEATPGPGAVDPATLGTDQVKFIATGDPAEVAAGKLTLEVIRRELASLVERRSADPHLHYLDGFELYGPADAEALPLPDGLHPGPEAHVRMGERFARLAFGEGGVFAEVVG
ncbi:SGNH/GDSL hydrolase family protein [Microlunatus flavus]|uniref:Lysophospholipase L1 n=1 Tax=Microlunatus flavus TaxID=1036181 RepID=A0A1H9MJ40_9ACTN|nr:SGNH/GDSL hydrolase family protein [Microlunatus flavus]SER23668.1 Lysophospholipase L1 [Microlunatus flavus]